MRLPAFLCVLKVYEMHVALIITKRARLYVLEVYDSRVTLLITKRARLYVLKVYDLRVTLLITKRAQLYVLEGALNYMYSKYMTSVSHYYHMYVI